MVRLLVPEGDDQHALTQKRPPPLGTEPLLIHSPWRSCTLAAVSTAFLSLAGRAHQGTFLRSVAYFSAADLSITACELYTRRELNKAIFKIDHVRPVPAKLWERTPWWTLEDVALYSGVFGLLLTLNPRVLPAATGWKRHVGVVTVSSAIGIQASQAMVPSLLGRSSYGAHRMEWNIAQEKKQLYRRLHQDDIARESLSRPAQFLLTYYTRDSVFGWLTGNSSLGSHGVKSPDSAAGQRQAVHSPSTEKPKEIIEFVARFDREELATRDYGRECRRMYKEDPAPRDQDTLREHLEHLEQLRATTTTELAYLWDELARKEGVLHQAPRNSIEKEMLQRELQLLNSMTLSTHMRVAVAEYCEAETRKRLSLIEREAPASNVSLSTVQVIQSNLGVEWKKTYRPEDSTERIRRHLTEKKDQMAEIEKWLSEFEKRKARESVLVHIHAEQIQSRAEALRMNIDATERLLREFEEQLDRAEYYSER